MLAAAALPAMAATATPAGGSSSSSLTLLGVTAVGHQVQALKAALSSSNLNGAGIASISVTPLLKDGAAAVPPVSVTNSTPNQPGVPSQQQSIAGVLSVTSPAAAMQATRTATGALAKISASGQNLLSVLGLPIGGSVSLSNLANVAGGDSSAGKQLTLTGLSLPSIKGLLGGLGLDLSKLPLDTLLNLVDGLGLSTATLDQAVSQVNAQIDSLQSQIDSVTQQITSQTATLTSDQSQLSQLQGAVTTAQTQLNSVISSVNAALGGTPLGSGLSLSTSNCPAVPSAIQTVLTTIGQSSLITQFATACSTLTSAQTALSSSNLSTLISQLQAAIDALQAQLTSLTNQLSGVTGPLVTQILGILDGTPLVSLAKLDVSTLAEAGTTHKADVTGTVEGLKVANTDILKAVTGSSTADITSLVGSTLSGVQSKISGLLGQLSSVLSSVPQLPDLKVPVPVVKVLQKSTSLDPVGGLQAARAAVTALQIDWAGLSIPDAVALPGVANLVPQSQQAHATLAGSPLSLTIGSMSDLAQARPGSTSTPQTTPGGTPAGTPSGSPLPMTGLAGWVPLTALVLVGAALGIRRWRSVQG